MREPPDPISNSEVKTYSADGSVGFPHVRVGHRQALITEKAVPERGRLFLWGNDYYPLRGDHVGVVMLVTKGRRAAINPVSGNGKPKISGPLTPVRDVGC